MSREILEQVVARAVGDAAFRKLLRTNPAAALRGYRLDVRERAAITSGDPARLVALGVDQRMSRAATIGDDYMRAAHRDAPEGDVTAASREIDPNLTQFSAINRLTGESGPAATEARIGEPPGGEFDPSLIAPPESATQAHLRLVEGMLDTTGTVAGDSLPADAMGVADASGIEGLHRLREGAAPDAAGIEGLHRLREGAESGVEGVGGTWRLREGAEPAAGDATPVDAMGPVDTDAQQESMTNVEWSKSQEATYTAESGQYDITARDVEGMPAGAEGGTVAPQPWPGDSLPSDAMSADAGAGIEGLHRLREGAEVEDIDTTQGPEDITQ